MPTGIVLAAGWQSATTATAQAAPPDSVRRVLDAVFAQPPYQWQAIEAKVPWLTRAWMALREWLDTLQQRNPEAFRLLFWGLVAVLSLVLAHAAFVAWRTVRGAATASGGVRESAAAPLRDAAWYAAEADRLAAEGRYAEAMQADFLRLMLQLDGRGVVKFHPSRTPVEYTRSPGLSADGRASLGRLVGALYRYAFARVPCGPSELAAWRAEAVAERYAGAH